MHFAYVSTNLKTIIPYKKNDNFTLFNTEPCDERLSPSILQNIECRDNDASNALTDIHEGWLTRKLFPLTDLEYSPSYVIVLNNKDWTYAPVFSLCPIWFHAAESNQPK